MDGIKEFLKKYPYKLESYHFFLLEKLWNFHHDRESDKVMFPKVERLYFEMAGFIALLKKAQKFRDRISIKYKDGSSIEIENPENIDYLLSKMNDLLISNRHEDYMEVFGWEERGKIPSENISKYKTRVSEDEYNYLIASLNESDYIEEPYNEEEIKKIYKYEKAQMYLYNPVMKQRLSFYLTLIVDQFVKDGIFKSGLKTISTEDACFLYDYLLLIGITDDETRNRHEKYEYIKFELRKLKIEDIPKNLRLLVP